MRWFVYNALFAVAYAAMMPSFLLRMKRRGGYRARMGDRFGRYPKALRFPENAVWVHAVSVGEVQVAGQLMREMRRVDPSVRFVFSTTSSTGWKTAEREVTDRDVLIYNPLDFPSFVRRAFDRIRPRAIVLTETEIWPNFLREAAARRVPLYLVNARISDRSAPRYRALRFFFSPVFRLFSKIYAQSALDAERLVAAGADAAAIETTGSVKFDVACRNPAKEKELREWIGEGDILLGGSTWPGEDAVLLDVYKKLRETRSDVKLVLAPRHFEKADAVEANIRAAGFACVRRSRRDKPSAEAPNVWLCDTTGEMMGLFGIATVAFVGKSLCAHGSQNMIEPCLCGTATVVGPYTENFRPVMSDLLEADALVQASDAEGVGAAILRLFNDAAARDALGVRATAAVQRRQGVTARLAREMLAAFPAAAPAYVRPRRPAARIVKALMLLWALSCFFVPARLAHAWWYLQGDVTRTWKTFVGLSLASVPYPTVWDDARNAVNALFDREVPGLDEDGVDRYRSVLLMPRAIVRVSTAAGPHKPARAIDVRRMNLARFKSVLEEEKILRGAWYLWCVGRYDFVVTDRFALPAEKLTALFADDRSFDALSDGSVYAPHEIFASYVGTDDEVLPAFADMPAHGALRGALEAPRFLFRPFPTNHLARVTPSRMTPYDATGFPGLSRGTLDGGVYAKLTNAIAAVQNARRTVLDGFWEADAGRATNAVARWAAAAAVHPRDPLLLNLADALDMEGRRRMRVGDMNGALRCYENRLDVRPGDVAAMHNFGVCMQRAGHPEFAAVAFARAGKLDPGNEAHHIAFAEAAAACGREEESLAVLAELAKKHPEDGSYPERIRRIRAHLFRKRAQEIVK